MDSLPPSTSSPSAIASHVVAKPKIRLELMPPELVCNILQYIDVRDIQDLITLLPDDDAWGHVRDECIRRLSVSTYLRKSFNTPSNLIEAMSKNFVVLSGSRSLDYFVRGSATKDSDWDFYHMGWSNPLSNFIESTSGISINWQTPIEHYVQMLKEGNGIMTMTKRAFSKAGADIFRHTAYSLGLTEYEESSTVTDGEHLSSEFVVIKVESLPNACPVVRLTTQIGATNYGGIVPVVIIHGTTTKHGEKVQLIVSNPDVPNIYSFMFDFHSSCVQSFITGHVAGHMYGLLANERRTIRWNPQTRGNNQAEDYEKAAGKYITDRGYTLVPQDRSDVGKNRTICDKDSTLVGPYNTVGAPGNVVQGYLRSAKDISWSELAGIGQTYSETAESSHEFNPLKYKAWTGAKVGPMCPLAYAWLA